MKRRDFLKRGLILGELIVSKSIYAEVPSAWPHLRAWNYEEFNKYSQWVENIYNFKKNGTTKQKQARFGRIVEDNEMNLLNNPDFLENGNPQVSKSEVSLLTSVTHCGSFPMLVFLYYSYRRGLPAIVSKIKMKRGGDIRYSSGNHPVGNVRSMPFDRSFRDFILNSLEGRDGGYNFVSGNFRTAPDLEGTDSLPVKITREFVKPGIMAYNANGHCLTIGKIDDSGEVHFLDSHPDHSITFNQTLSALPFINSCRTDKKEKWYDGFKIIRLSRVINNCVVPFTNSEMELYGASLDQHEAMANIRLSKQADKKSYPDFIRTRLQKSREIPLRFLEETIIELGEMFRERAGFIQEAWNDVLANGPIIFPNDSQTENIYQADGRWEVWSSPSSDVDRKQKYNYLAIRLEQIAEGFPDSPEYDYTGFNSRQQLVQELLKVKNKGFSEQVVNYANSNKENISLTLLDVEQRLFDLSFDPNHCPELRWGAPEKSIERKNMKLLKTPLSTGQTLDALKSYELEKGLRYYPLRQEDSTSLNPKDNPDKPPFELIDKRLAKYLK